jgi:hypothetical protein
MKVFIGGYRNPWTTQRAEQRWYKWRYDKWDWEIKEEDRDLWDHAFFASKRRRVTSARARTTAAFAVLRVSRAVASVVRVVIF